MSNAPKDWIGVASRDHVRTGVADRFAQVGHGKAGPVRRLTAGDWIVDYSPRDGMSAGAPVRAFTAIGRVLGGKPYPAAMGQGFTAMRRDVDFLAAREAPVRPLPSSLSFFRHPANWGMAFHPGTFAISAADLTVIAAAMGVAEAVG